MDLLERFPLLRIAPRVAGVAVDRLRNRHSDSLREHPDRFRERHLLVELEKFEDVAADAAAEAVKEPFIGVDVKGRRFLGMKRAQSLVGVADPLERDIFLHDLHDVGLQPEIVDERLGKQRHQSIIP